MIQGILTYRSENSFQVCSFSPGQQLQLWASPLIELPKTNHTVSQGGDGLCPATNSNPGIRRAQTVSKSFSTTISTLAKGKNTLWSTSLASFDFHRCESKSEVAQSCPVLCDPMDCSPPDSSIHGILQAGMLEWVAVSFTHCQFHNYQETGT